MRVHEQDARWFKFKLGLALFHLILYFKISEIHLNFWEHVNTCGIILINNLPSVEMKASTLWNFNELNF
jgi:hypothetical protein